MLLSESFPSLSQGHHWIEKPDVISSIDEMLLVHFGDYKPSRENSRSVLQHKWNSGYIAKDWERHDFLEEHSGLITPCMSSRIPNPMAEIRFPLGYKAIPQAYERVAHFWNALGYDVSFMMLPYTDRECGFIDAYDRSVHQYLTDETLAIHKKSKPDISKIVVTHSTTGLCLGRNRLDPIKEQQYSDKYVEVICMASFFGMSGANHVHGKKTYKRFKKYAADETLNWRTREMKKNPRLDLFSGETWAGKTYLQYLRYFKKDPDIFSSIDDPTLGQMRELAKACEEYYEALEDAKPLTLPTHYFIPDYDTVACPKLQREIALKQNMPSTSIKCYHSLALENPFDGLKKVTEHIEAKIAVNKPSRNLVFFTRGSLSNIVHSRPL